MPTIDRTCDPSVLAQLKTIVSQDDDEDTVADWYTQIVAMDIRKTITWMKNVVEVADLSEKARCVYSNIIQFCPTDEDVLFIRDLIIHGPEIRQKPSGRTVDVLVTRFPDYYDVSYYLDITDPNNTFIVDEPYKHGRDIILFDIGSSYRQKMHQYSKTYFDCFGRGEVVNHILHSGESVAIQLCQFTFFVWAHRFKVFEFLDRRIADVVRIRKQNQKKTYQPKKKRKVPDAPMVTNKILGRDRTRIYPNAKTGQNEIVIQRKVQTHVMVAKTRKQFGPTTILPPVTLRDYVHQRVLR